MKEKGDLDAAFEMYSHCLQIHPTSAVTLFELAKFYMFLGQQQKGEKALALTGIGILLFGSSIFLNIDPKIPVAIVVVFMCIRCFGIAFMNLLTTNTAMAAVPSELSGHASSLTNWVRQIVSALIISIASTLINAQLVASNAQTVEEVSAAYLSSTSLLYAISCAALIIIIPIALKFFRGQKDM